MEDVQVFLAGARIDPSVWEMRPDYRAVLVTVEGIEPRASDDMSERWLVEAESVARDYLDGITVEELPEIASWREAYRAFGAKPQRTRNSLEALVRRVDAGLPRINRLTDLYNAISVVHRLPLGGEDLDAYSGPPHLVRSQGTESFDTVDRGESIVETPDVGEVIWCDDVGVTCRRWNWRQCQRTRLLDSSTSALFILDALAPLTDAALETAADDLQSRLELLGTNVRIGRRFLGMQ